MLAYNMMNLQPFVRPLLSDLIRCPSDWMGANLFPGKPFWSLLRRTVILCKHSIANISQPQTIWLSEKSIPQTDPFSPSFCVSKLAILTSSNSEQHRYILPSWGSLAFFPTVSLHAEQGLEDESETCFSKTVLTNSKSGTVFSAECKPGELCELLHQHLGLDVVCCCAATRCWHLSSCPCWWCPSQKLREFHRNKWIVAFKVLKEVVTGGSYDIPVLRSLSLLSHSNCLLIRLVCVKPLDAWGITAGCTYHNSILGIPQNPQTNHSQPKNDAFSKFCKILQNSTLAMNNRTFLSDYTAWHCLAHI